MDTGSEITAISMDLWEEISQLTTRPIPTLPLRALQIQGAFGKKSQKVTKQILLSVEINSCVFPMNCLVITNLIRPCIIGIDWMTEQNCKINLHNQIVTLENDKNIINLPFFFSAETSPNMKPVSDLQTITYPHIKKVSTIDLILQKIQEAELNDVHKQQLRQVLLNFLPLFSDKPGLTNRYIHKIEMKSNETFVKRNYPVPFALRKKVEDELHKMEDQGIIERASSPYSSPITIVKKANGEIRICARIVNENMIADTETPPAPEELLQRFHNITCLTAIDLVASYWQIPLSPESRQYTAFIYNGRSYVFKVLPFGLKTAVGSFSRAMDIILGPEVREFTYNYIDDLLIVSQSFTEHLEHIQKVLSRLKAANLTVNLGKSAFVRKQVTFLGHILTPSGILKDPGKTQAIFDFPRPTKLKQLRGFLGLSNYYRKFCQNYSLITDGLSHLLKKGSKWSWGPEEEVCF